MKGVIDRLFKYQNNHLLQPYVGLNIDHKQQPMLMQWLLDMKLHALLNI